MAGQNPYQLALDGLRMKHYSDVPNSRLVPKKVLQEQDPSVGAFNFDNAMSDEAALSAAQYAGLGDANKVRQFDRIAELFGGRAERSPIMQQKAMVDSFNQQNIAAAHEGFGAGEGQSALQSREIYKRQQAEKNSDANVETIRGQYDVEQQKEMSRGLERQAEVGADARVLQAENLVNLVRGAGPGAVSRVSVPGGGSVSFDQPAPIANPAYDAIRQARQAYVAARESAPRGLGAWIPGASARSNALIKARKDALDQSVNSWVDQLVQRDPSKAMAAQRARQLYNNPQYTDNDPSQTIIDDIIGAGMADPQTASQILEILSVIRGR